MSFRAGVRRIILSVVVLQLVASGSAQAQLRTQAIASGLGPVVGVVPDPVYAGVLHVIQQDGIVRTIQGTSVLATPFLDVRTVISSGGERGLLGLAFAPDTAGGRVFVTLPIRAATPSLPASAAPPPIRWQPIRRRASICAGAAPAVPPSSRSRFRTTTAGI